MELDEFKQRIKEKEPQENIIHSGDELEGYIRKRTGSIISKIKRSIVFELLACIFFIAIAVWIWFDYSFSYTKACAMLTIFLSVILIIYLAALYKKITLYEQSPLTVKNSLQEVITILEQFTRSYFQFVMITLPIAFIFGLITGFVTIKGNTAIQHFNWQKAILFYTGWFIFWCVLMYFFSKWYIKKLYGNYLHQLKEELKDIENG